MNRPEPLRRRAIQKEASGQRAVLACAVLLALAALGFAAWREAADPRFAVHLEHIDGIVHTSAADVIAAAALTPAQNAWLINRRAVQQRVEALPWVGRATLRVTWPNHLSIHITERRPLAVVPLLSPGGGEEPVPRFAVIDETRRVLTLDDRLVADSQLPRLILTPPPANGAAPGAQLAGRDVAAALDALRQLRSLGLQVSEVAIAPSTGISAKADRNLRVLFGDDEDLAQKAALFQAIVAKISTPERIAYVDVRSVRAPTVLYR